MLTKDTVNKEIDFLEKSRDLCVSYEQISMMRMNAIKKGVLTTRDFYEDVTDVYHKVEKVYKRQIALLENKHGGKQRQRVSVFLSADNKLYGDILNKVFHLFISDIQKEETDIIIVGSLGKSMFDAAGMKKPYTYISLPHADSELTLTDLKEIASHFALYEDIDVYFGKYESYINQKAVRVNITGEILFEEEESESKESLYYFEPSLEKVARFFETQMVTALFKQSVYEGQLARYASRIGSMEEALHAIKKENALMEMQKRKTLAQERDMKQNERIVQLFYRH